MKIHFFYNNPRNLENNGWDFDEFVALEIYKVNLIHHVFSDKKGFNWKFWVTVNR